MTTNNPQGREPHTKKGAGDGEDTPHGAAKPTLDKPEDDLTREIAAQSVIPDGGGDAAQKTDEMRAEPTQSGTASYPTAEADAAVEAETGAGKLTYGSASTDQGEAEALDRRDTAADDDVFDEPKPLPRQEPEKKSGSSLIWIIAVLLAVGLGGYFTWPSWSPQIAGYIPQSIREQSWFPAIPGDTTQTATNEGVPAEPSEDQTAQRSAPAGEQQTAVPDTSTPQATDPDTAAETSPSSVGDTQQTADQEPVTGRSETTGSTDETQVSDLINRLNALEQELAALRSGSAAAGQSAPVNSSIEPTIKRLEAVETELASAKAGLDSHTAETQKKDAELDKRLGDVESRASNIEQAAKTVLAIRVLETTADGGQGFSSQLGTVKSIVGDEPSVAEALSNLEVNAGGVPTLESLKSTFPQVRDAIMLADVASEEGDWTDRLVGRLQGLYVFRGPGEGDPEAEGVEGAIAGAEQALANNDLAAAVSALQGVEGPEAAVDWLSSAKSRLIVDESIAQVRQDALARLTNNTGS